jgi:flagellar motility protein MotE (MotC chaperone)
MKKYLLYAGMFLASFAVINTGMYFFLSATQPKSIVAAHEESGDADADSNAHGDVTHHEAESPEANVETHAEPAPVAASPESPVENHVEARGPQSAPANATVTEPRKKDKPRETTIAQDAPEEMAQAEQAAQAEEPIPDDPVVEIASPAASADTSSFQLTKLAKLLESMKPADAAAIASELESDVIVAIVLRMKDRSAAKLMAALPVEIAQDVAQQMTLMSAR